MVLALLLLSACATAPPPTPANPYTNLAIEDARASCLRADRLWCETQELVRCLERASTAPRAAR